MLKPTLLASALLALLVPAADAADTNVKCDAASLDGKDGHPVDRIGSAGLRSCWDKSAAMRARLAP